MGKQLIERIKSIEKLSEDMFSITIESSYMVEKASPGQFINIKCCDGLDSFLRRPISICDLNKEQGTFDIVFQVRGKGTEKLSNKHCSNQIDFLGPLGNGFMIKPEYKRVAVVGGGIGTFPLLFLLRKLNVDYKASFLGYRNKESIILEDKFKCFSNDTFISTEDGSIGFKGFVTEALEEKLNEVKPDIIYCCGPTVMMKRVSEIAKNNKIPCQLSLEQRMGCGIGACLVCACKLKKDNEWVYGHVCKDGPVFWNGDVILD